MHKKLMLLLSLVVGTQLICSQKGSTSKPALQSGQEDDGSWDDEDDE